MRSLYEECIDVLLEHWRAPTISQWVNRPEGRRALQPAALWLHRKRAAPGPRPMNWRRTSTGAKAVEWQRNGRRLSADRPGSSGLADRLGSGHYGFMHLGFQEYLAAREIRSRIYAGYGKSDALESGRTVRESWWQEVTLLLLALEDPSLFVPFMREVVRRARFHPA